MEATTRATDGARWRDAIDPEVEDRLAAAVEELAQLPVLDATVLSVLAAVDDPDTTTADLVAILETDPSFAANLLRYANSAARAHPIRAQTIRQAVMLVGRSALHHLALETATCRFLEHAPGAAAERADLQADAVAAASVALIVCERLGADQDAPHLGALLHDLGKLVLPLAADPGACEAIAARHRSGVARATAEREHLGVDHALAGALLAERWNLPEGLPEAIAFHHGGSAEPVSPTAEIAIVQIATHVPRIAAGHEPDEALLDVALARCGADQGLVDELVGLLRPADALDRRRRRRRRSSAAAGQPSVSSSPRSATSPASSVL